MPILSQPIKNMAGRVPAKASQPIANRAGRIVDDCGCVVRHDHIANKLIGKSVANLAERIHEDSARMIALKDWYTVVCHKGDVMKCIRLV